MAKTIKKTNTTNKFLFDTIVNLKKFGNKNKIDLYKAVAFELSRAASQRAEVNLSKIDKYCDKKGFVIIPGKVLGNGILTKEVNVVAFGFSQSAIQKYKKQMVKHLQLMSF